jgi:hypothetical protein
VIALVGLTPDDDVGSKFTVPSDSAYQLFGAARITMPPGQRWRQIGGSARGYLAVGGASQQSGMAY